MANYFSATKVEMPNAWITALKAWNTHNGWKKGDPTSSPWCVPRGKDGEAYAIVRAAADAIKAGKTPIFAPVTKPAEKPAKALRMPMPKPEPEPEPEPTPDGGMPPKERREFLDLLFKFSDSGATRDARKVREELKAKFPELADMDIMERLLAHKYADFYPTPRRCLEESPDIENVIFNAENVLEPTAGIGSMVDVIKDINPHAKVTANELNKGFADFLEKIFGKSITVTQENFLEYTEENNYDLIVANPPFTFGNDKQYYLKFLFKSLKMLNNSKAKGLVHLIFVSPQFLDAKVGKNDYFDEGMFFESSKISLALSKYIGGKDTRKLIGMIAEGETPDDEDDEDAADAIQNDYGFSQALHVGQCKGFGGTGVTASIYIFTTRGRPEKTPKPTEDEEAKKLGSSEERAALQRWNDAKKARSDAIEAANKAIADFERTVTQSPAGGGDYPDIIPLLSSVDVFTESAPDPLIKRRTINAFASIIHKTPVKTSADAESAIRHMFKVVKELRKRAVDADKESNAAVDKAYAEYMAIKSKSPTTATPETVQNTIVEEAVPSDEDDLRAFIKSFNADSNASPDILGYISTNSGWIMGVLHILKKYKSDCIAIRNPDFDFTISMDSIPKTKQKAYDAFVTEVIAGGIRDCLRNSKAQIVVIPLGLEAKKPRQMGHANVLIYRRPTHTFEVFEPHGAGTMIGDFPEIDATRTKYIKLVMEDLIKSGDVPATAKLDNTHEVCPYISGFQSIEGKQQRAILEKRPPKPAAPKRKKKTAAAEPESTESEDSGFCAIWSIFYIETVLRYPTLTSSQIVTRARTELMNMGQFGFYKHITEYVKSLYSAIANEIGTDVIKFPMTAKTKDIIRNAFSDYASKILEEIAKGKTPIPKNRAELDKLRATKDKLKNITGVTRMYEIRKKYLGGARKTAAHSIMPRQLPDALKAWNEALRRFNEGASKRCIPIKGTPEHAKVKAIQQEILKKKGGNKNAGYIKLLTAKTLGATPEDYPKGVARPKKGANALNIPLHKAMRNPSLNLVETFGDAADERWAAKHYLDIDLEEGSKLPTTSFPGQTTPSKSVPKLEVTEMAEFPTQDKYKKMTAKEKNLLMLRVGKNPSAAPKWLQTAFKKSSAQIGKPRPPIDIEKATAKYKTVMATEREPTTTVRVTKPEDPVKAYEDYKAELASQRTDKAIKGLSTNLTKDEAVAFEALLAKQKLAAQQAGTLDSASQKKLVAKFKREVADFKQKVASRAGEEAGKLYKLRTAAEAASGKQSTGYSKLIEPSDITSGKQMSLGDSMSFIKKLSGKGSHCEGAGKRRKGRKIAAKPKPAVPKKRAIKKPCPPCPPCPEFPTLTRSKASSSDYAPYIPPETTAFQAAKKFSPSETAVRGLKSLFAAPPAESLVARQLAGRGVPWWARELDSV